MMSFWIGADGAARPAAKADVGDTLREQASLENQLEKSI